MKKIKKYYAIFIISLQGALNYRAELFLWSITDAMPLVGMLILWLTAFDGGIDNIAGYTQASLIAYYISGYLFQDVTGSHFEEDIIKEIQSGKITTRLVKPISIKRLLVTGETSWRVMSLVHSTIPIAFLAWVFARDIMPAIKLIHVLIMPIILIMAYLLEAIYSLFIIAIAFVFEEARSLMHLKWMLGWLFSGSMIPFEFMPDWLSSISYYLPFKFRQYIPIQFYFGNLSGNKLITQIALELFWLLSLLIILRMVWRRNIKNFTAVGN